MERIKLKAAGTEQPSGFEFLKAAAGALFHGDRFWIICHCRIYADRGIFASLFWQMDTERSEMGIGCNTSHGRGARISFWMANGLVAQSEHVVASKATLATTCCGKKELFDKAVQLRYVGTDFLCNRGNDCSRLRRRLNIKY